MKIKILKTVPASLDGVNVREFQFDEIVEIDENQPRAVELAHSLARDGYAEIVSDTEAAAHVKELSELHPDEAAARKVDHEVFEQLEKNAERKTKRESRGKGRKSAAAAAEPERIAISPGPGNVVISATSSTPPPPPAETWVPVVGDVVQEQGVGPFMTIEKLAGDLADLVWFAENDHSAPKRNVFQLADLVKVKGS